MSSFQVLSKQIIAQNVKRMDIAAPEIAHSLRPGQFILLMVDASSLRLPFFVVETNPQKGSLTIVFREESLALQKLGSLSIGQRLHVVMGPLGNPVPPSEKGTNVCIGYELGIAQMVPLSRYLQKQGNKNIGILGAATKRRLLMESQMRLSCQSLFVMSEDGSAGKRGSIKDALVDVFARYPVEHIFVAAPSKIVQEILPLAQEKKTNLKAMLFPLALSGIGFCGTDEIKLKKGCLSLSTEGPIVDARLIDFHAYEAKLKRFYGTD